MDYEYRVHFRGGWLHDDPTNCHLLYLSDISICHDGSTRADVKTISTALKNSQQLGKIVK